MQLDVDVSPPANIMSVWLTSTQVTFDLDPCDLDFDALAYKDINWDQKSFFWPGDPGLWPMTLTFKVDLRVIHAHALTKFQDPSCNTFRDMNYCPVILV